MARTVIGLLIASAAVAAPLACQTTSDPIPDPVPTSDPIVVGVVEFATLPGVGGEPARMMEMIHEPTSDRYFVNGMRGPIWIVSGDGSSVAEYVDIDDPRWGVGVESGGRERGFQNFALHPDFAREGAPGYGLFYSWSDTENNEVTADFTPGGGDNTHHTVLHEWRATDPTAASYDGEVPRELLRLEQPFGNHNAGDLDFDPTLAPGDPGHGMLYVGVADGGSGGDPLNLAQNRGSIFGKILRIDPLGSNASNGEYGIPGDNPFVGEDGTLGEIWALGLRNPQGFGWDPETGVMYVAEIGQNTLEEISPVPRGGNLGWNVWEGSWRFVGREGVDASGARSDPAMTYPVVEWDHQDPILIGRAAAAGVVVQRSSAIPGLTDRVMVGDFPSGEIFAFDADDAPEGGSAGMRRVLLDAGTGPGTLVDLMRAKNAQQGRDAASRTDLRFATGPGGAVFLLNKHDGTIRRLVPAG